MAIQADLADAARAGAFVEEAAEDLGGPVNILVNMSPQDVMGAWRSCPTGGRAALRNRPRHIRGPRAAVACA